MISKIKTNGNKTASYQNLWDEGKIYAQKKIYSKN